jgi:hypothetical protein
MLYFKLVARRPCRAGPVRPEGLASGGCNFALQFVKK